nr:MAG TPA: hypothetical protein [Caudoviricetes sp.]
MTIEFVQGCSSYIIKLAVGRNLTVFHRHGKLSSTLRRSNFRCFVWGNFPFL